MKKNIPKLYPETYYHIYNRGNNGENLFLEERNYNYFLEKLALYILPVAKIYAYVLLKNHFHLLIETRTAEELCQFKAGKNTITHKEVFAMSEDFLNEFDTEKIISQQFNSLFKSYSQSINKGYNRKGSLFERPFRRIPITTVNYLREMVWYIHFNPQKHGFVDDFKEYRHSSFQLHRSDKPTKLERDYLLSWFRGLQGYDIFHGVQHNELSKDLLLEEEK
jgi:REP element-mobilizing transposase RayT